MIKRLWTNLAWRLFPLFETFGLHVLPVHYYSPIPDTRELRAKRALFDAHHPMPGVELDLDRQMRFVETVVQPWEREYRDAGGGRFGLDASRIASYAPANALTLYGMVRHYRPARVIEVGSGMSTSITAAALSANAAEGKPASYTVIDPYANPDLIRSCAGAQIMRRKVEDVGLEPFLELDAGDILFIDSSHTVKIFGDVNFLFLTVLPRLRPGVIVHVHDIFFPREYLPHHFFRRQTKQVWQEQYLLHAFLLFNREFEVLVSWSYLHFEAPAALTALFPWYHTSRCPSSSWMRRRQP